MRRFRIPTLLLAAAVALTACDLHEFPGDTGDSRRDFSLKLAFSDELPELQNIAPTKAGESAKLRYTILLWRYENQTVFNVRPDYSFTFQRSSMSELDTTIFLPVNPAKYRVAGWVDWVGGEAGPGYDLTDPEHVVYPDYSSGEYVREAFTVVTDYDVDGMYAAGETYQKTVTLERPVAKLRIVAPEALTFLTMTGLDLSEMNVTLRYTMPIPEGYNILTGATYGVRSNVTMTCKPRLDTSGELVFVSDYLFLADDNAAITVDFTLSDTSGKDLIDYSGEVPLRDNHSTTVSFDTPYGGDEKPGGIGISPGFDDEIEVPID